jgi:hypothetical protein
MNKLSYQPLPILSRVETSDAPWTSNSAKILWVIATLSTFSVLLGAVVICLIGFKAFTPHSVEMKTAVAAASVSVSTPGSNTKESDLGKSPAATQILPETAPEDHSIPAQPSAPAIPSTPAPGAEKSVSDSEMLNAQPEATPTSHKKQLLEKARKKLEKKRRAAERKRAKLEAMSEQKAISDRAYKNGEQKYQHAIAKYRKAMHAGMGTLSEQ